MSIIAVSALLLCSAFGPAAAVVSLRLQAGLVDQSAYERRGSGLDREALKRPLLTWGGAAITALAVSRNAQPAAGAWLAKSHVATARCKRDKGKKLKPVGASVLAMPVLWRLHGMLKLWAVQNPFNMLKTIYLVI